MNNTLKMCQLLTVKGEMKILRDIPSIEEFATGDLYTSNINVSNVLSKIVVEDGRVQSNYTITK